MDKIRMARRLIQKAGPYLLLEILLPGGTLFALALFLYRRGQVQLLDDVQRAGRAVAETVGEELEQVSLALQPAYIWS